MIENIDAIAGFTPAYGLPAVEPANGTARLGMMQPFDTYHWEKVSGPTCRDGQLHETWCYIECAGGTCQALWCEDRIVGSC